MKYVIALLLLVSPISLKAQNACKNPETEDCSVNDAIEFYRGATGAPLLFEVVNANRATTPPDAFARRLHNSYEDFLNLLSFAISDVEESEDGQALVVEALGQASLWLDAYRSQTSDLRGRHESHSREPSGSDGEVIGI
jgi:hypothetical protein